ncbi:MAG: acyl carrier protein [Bacillota bacterium]
MDAVDIAVMNIFKRVTNSDVPFDRELTPKDGSGWDSLNHVLVLLEIESEFSIRLDVQELTELKNLGDLLDLIKRKVKAT